MAVVNTLRTSSFQFVPVTSMSTKHQMTKKTFRGQNQLVKQKESVYTEHAGCWQGALA